MSEPLIIVDADGVEHEFPAEMDPKQAAAVVRNRAAGNAWALPGPAQTASGDPEADALARFAQQHPRTAATAAGVAVGAPTLVAAGLAGAPGLLATAGRIVAHPLTGAITGAAQGYRREGLPGVPLGAMEGAIAAKLGGGLLARGIGALRTATAPTEAAAAGLARPGAEALTNLGRNLVLSPTDAARKAQLMRLALQEAKEGGTVAAGRQVRTGPGLIEELFGQ